MAYSEILYDVSDRIATLTLNRPEKLNAWTNQMGVEVRAALLAAEEDADVRVIILTGAGRGFCAGADMGMLQSAAASGVDRRIMPPQPEPARNSANPKSQNPGFQRRYSYFPSIKKPILAAMGWTNFSLCQGKITHFRAERVFSLPRKINTSSCPAFPGKRTVFPRISSEDVYVPAGR